MTRLPCESSGGSRGRVARPTCAAARCPKPAAPGRRVCNTCRDRKWRARYPELHLWNNLKKSAKRRGLAFTITQGWWLSWCEMTGFAELVGRTKGCASIDRVRPWEGYTETNIQMLEVGANSAKGQLPPPINSEEHHERFYSEAENPLSS